ncbi:MAG TPA: molybdopterin-dependent oxidoreductase [Solirubrobacteraceae bacterium]|jgi:DMSO/TMAO reductase YedYZ molybdopterin-dependent catalytic subunit|nr:molybdopterin-dependent oxidoreductase [Solirubrobacteraceae bacterium]
MVRLPRAVGPFRDGAFPSPLRSERTAALLGVALGMSFLTCFVTGLVSHLAQHPLHVGFLSMPARPAGLYRVTQGLHVATGIASIPLLIAKLWTVFPRLFAWPPVQNVAHAIERISLVPLVAGSIFQLSTGLANLAHWYPWQFGFTVAHFWTGWIVIGALVVHVGAKLTVTRRSLGAQARAAAAHEAAAARPAADRAAHEDRAAPVGGGGLDRRGFLAAVGLAVVAVTATTVGQTVRPLRRLALFAPRRPDVGPQGLPVNKSAVGARVVADARSADYRLTVGGAVTRPLSLTRGELLAMAQHSADLPIVCVEGWSAGGVWSGVRVRDLVALAGADPEHSTVEVRSLQRRSAYRTSQLNAQHVRDGDTLLALAINGAPLHLDHGYPCRLVAPNRPGVQQTKWVAHLEVL